VYNAKKEKVQASSSRFTCARWDQLLIAMLLFLCNRETVLGIVFVLTVQVRDI
jgi:hypothetical protein